MEITRTGRVHYLAPHEESGIAVMGFTTRHEGVSRPPYNSLNLGINTDDPNYNVEGNRSILTRAFGIDIDKLVTVRQTHSSDILAIDEPNDDFTHFTSIEADVIITNQPGVMIGVTVADCVPLLLLDPVKSVIAAVHAGWKGTAEKVTEKTVKAMQELFGSRAENLLAAIGPCIGQCCYEVDKDVQAGFVKNGIQWESVAEASSPGKWNLDLALANRIQLEDSGVCGTSIQSAGKCVCCHKELFFSYRRDEITGRQMGFIMLKPKAGKKES